MASAAAIYQGIRQVDAIFLSAHYANDAAREQILIAHHCHGARAFRFAQGDVLRFASPEWHVETRDPGLAVLAIAHLQKPGTKLWCSAAFSAEECHQHRDADLLLRHHGAVLALQWQQAVELKLADRLDLSGYAYEDCVDLSAAVTGEVLQQARALEGKDVRTLLGASAPSVSDAQRSFLQSLEPINRGRSGAIEGLASRRGEGSLSSAARRVLWLAVGAIGRALQTLTNVASEASSSTVPARAVPHSPGWWRRSLTQLIQMSRISALLSWRQMQYLRQLQEKFERGDLLDALRHAPSLARLGQSLGTTMQNFAPRADFSLSQSPGGRTSAVDMPEHVFDWLGQMYRKSFAQLDRAGAIDQAVFVLAELLEARTEALDYLERQQRYQQAAELALRWDMPAATIVRLLMIAGDMERALAVARRDNCFSQVLQQLKDRHPKHAEVVRLQWANYLADQARWLEATEVIWPLPQARALAVNWIDRALQIGGASTGRALARKAELLPDAILQDIATAQALCADPEQAELREALALALLKSGNANAAQKFLVRALFPNIALDRRAQRNTLGKMQLRQLLQNSSDPYLRADSPDFIFDSPPAQVFDVKTPICIDPETGNVKIYDAVPLDGQRFLCACGEEGVFVIDQRGKVKSYFVTPATHLVFATGGLIALLLIKRETVWRIARLDLSDGSVRDLGSMALQFFSRELNGVAWSVVHDNRLCVIDCAKSLDSLLWHLADIGTVLEADYHFGKETYLTHDHAGKLQIWIYQSGTRALQSREFVDASGPDQYTLAALKPDFLPVLVPSSRTNELCFRNSFKTTFREVGLPVESSTAMHERYRVGAHWLIEVEQSDGFRLALLAPGASEPSLIIDWPLQHRYGDNPSERYTLRSTHDWMLLTDTTGRIFSFDFLQSRATRAVLRV